MHLSTVLLALFTGIAVHAVPNENGVEFLFPTDGLTLNYLDTINVTYTSPFKKPLLYTFCTNKTDTKKLIEKERIDATPFNASHLFTLNYKDVAECYWNLRPNTSTGFGGNSFKVKLLTEGRSSTTIGLSPTQQTGTSTPTPSEVSDGGMSTGAKAGIGAGVGAAALVATIALALFLLRRKKNKAAAIGESKAAGNDSDAHGGTAYPPGYSSPQQQHQEYYKGQPHQSAEGAESWGGPKMNEMSAHQERQIYEMSSEPRIAEVPGSAVKT